LGRWPNRRLERASGQADADAVLAHNDRRGTVASKCSSPGRAAATDHNLVVVSDHRCLLMKDLGASYNVSYGGSRASLLTNLMTTGSAYTLVVEFENNSSMTVNVKPTPEISGPSEKWMNCLAAFLQHQRPPQ
jgi:hypothetical protein